MRSIGAICTVSVLVIPASTIFQPAMSATLFCRYGIDQRINSQLPNLFAVHKVVYCIVGSSSVVYVR